MANVTCPSYELYPSQFIHLHDFISNSPNFLFHHELYPQTIQALSNRRQNLSQNLWEFTILDISEQYASGECSSVVESLPSMYRAVGFILCTSWWGGGQEEK